VGAQRALGRAGNTMSPAEVDAVVIGLVDRITGRMRAAGRTGRTVTLRLRFNDFGRATRSHTLPWATSSTQTILATARQLVASAAPLIAERGLTLVGFAVSEIDRSGAEQLMLPHRPRRPRRLRRRPGASPSKARERGVLVGRDPGVEMPHLPD
jgi:DNA polymerase-4